MTKLFKQFVSISSSDGVTDEIKTELKIVPQDHGQFKASNHIHPLTSRLANYSYKRLGKFRVVSLLVAISSRC